MALCSIHDVMMFRCVCLFYLLLLLHHRILAPFPLIPELLSSRVWIHFVSPSLAGVRHP